MLLYLLPCGSLILYTIGEFCQIPGIRHIGFFISTLALLLLLTEFDNLKRYIRDLAVGSKQVFRSRRFLGFSSQYTSMLSSIKKQLEWIEEIATEKIATVKVSSLNENRGSETEKFSSFADVCKELICDLHEVGGALECAVIWSDETGTHHLSSLQADSRICIVKRHLECQLQSLCSNEVFISEGIVRFERSDFLGSILSLQGFATANWWRIDSESDLKAFLWCGYGDYISMTALEKQIVRRAIQKFQYNINAFNQLSSLEIRVEEELVMNQKKDAFLSHFSHDVRTPLSMRLPQGSK